MSENEDFNGYQQAEAEEALGGQAHFSGHPLLSQEHLKSVIELRNQMAQKAQELTAFINGDEEAVSEPPECVLIVPPSTNAGGYMGVGLFTVHGSFDALRQAINLQNAIAGSE